MSCPLVSFKANSILMENGRKTQQNRMTMALPVNATRRDRDGGGEGGAGGMAGVSAATLFYKFRPSALTVHAKQVNKQKYYSFQ